MTEEENQGQPTPENEVDTDSQQEEKKSEESSGERTFTQKDMDKVAGQRAKEAKKAAYEAAMRDILEKAGAESIDEVIQGHQSFKTIEEETATETEKERKAREKAEARAQEAEQKAQEAQAHANSILIKSELKASLIGEGARSDRLARLIKEADLSEVEVDEDEVKNLKPVIETLKQEIPEWFGSDEQPAGSRPSSRAATGPTNQQIDKEIAEREKYRVASAL